MSREEFRKMIEKITDVRNENKRMYVWVNFVMIEKSENCRFEVSYNDRTDEYTLFLVDMNDYALKMTAMEHLITNISYEVVE